jgi:hypothetical protein
MRSRARKPHTKSARRSAAAREVERVRERGQELCGQVGDDAQLFSVLFGLRGVFAFRVVLHGALELDRRLLNLAERGGGVVRHTSIVIHLPVQKRHDFRVERTM